MCEVKLSWKDLSSLEVGGAICLPVIMVGHKLLAAYGLKPALSAVVLGNVILFLLAQIMVRMSYENKKSTPDNAREYFGKKAAAIFSLCLLLAKCCWFAIQLNLMGQSAADYLEVLEGKELYAGFFNVLMGCLIVLTALYGVQAISSFSRWSMPLLIGTMAYAVFAVPKGEIILSEGTVYLEPVSIAIATAITAVIDMPTYFRFMRSLKDGKIASALLFLAAIPLIECVGIYLAYHNPQANVFETITGKGTPLWNLWVLIFLIFAGMTTNNANLFSASVAMHSLFNRLSSFKSVLAMGLLGIALSLSNILSHFTLVLQLMGVTIASMGAIIMVNYLMAKKIESDRVSFINLGIWLLGVIAGFSSIFKVLTITAIPLLDSFLIAALGALGKALQLKKIGASYENNH